MLELGTVHTEFGTVRIKVMYCTCACEEEVPEAPSQAAFCCINPGSPNPLIEYEKSASPTAGVFWCCRQMLSGLDLVSSLHELVERRIALWESH